MTTEQPPVQPLLLRPADRRYFTIMHTLLYPGVLGSLMYAIPDNIIADRIKNISGQMVAVWFAFYFAFVLDYTHSITERAQSVYSIGTFAADLLIIVMLFFAGQRIMGTPLLPAIDTPWFLAAAKMAALAWELVVWLGTGQTASPDRQVKKSEPVSDLVFACAYGLIALLTTGSACWLPGATESGIVSVCDWWHWVLAVVLLLDALSYVTLSKVAAVFQRPAR